ncbi:MAG: hypothetical protein IJU56_05160 [Clostridia bacterium]|nr:hypothetical protein [Clostridia bacterium]
MLVTPPLILTSRMESAFEFQGTAAALVHLSAAGIAPEPAIVITPSESKDQVMLSTEPEAATAANAIGSVVNRRSAERRIASVRFHVFFIAWTSFI